MRVQQAAVLLRLVVAMAAFLTATATVPIAAAQMVARCGAGWLEVIDGYRVLHVEGSPYEMGYQHGVLLKEAVTANLNHIVYDKMMQPLAKWGPLQLQPISVVRTIVNVQQQYIPPDYTAELRGLADGAGLAFEDVQAANFVPELFHCSGFAVMNSATEDGTLYHGRVLDYAIDWRLQQHAVLIVAKPRGGIPFVNVSYAGFIGSVTGMNAAHVSIGEMGGRGLGQWEGVPMAVLVRRVLQEANDLDEAVAVFRDNPRTCQYFYVIADGKTNRAVGMEASWNRFETLAPGQANERLPTPVEDCVLLSAGSRYRELVRRTKAHHGRISADVALELMSRPVAMSSNLHNVLFEPRSTAFWVANATADKQPAADQPYHHFSLQELLSRSPEP